MTSDIWSGRADAYVESDAHREGEDLDQLVAWAAGARTALDVATGGGHVARRLREAGLEVVTSDPAPGMRPDVVSRAESLPFADGAFDVVTFAGGRPANFCDLGGGGDAQGVVDALSVITQDPQVKAIFFNIFGGITRCDEVARGILQALGDMSLELPIVVRLDGTNAEEGRTILAEAAPANLRVSPTMLDAAKLAVELAA